MTKEFKISTIKDLILKIPPARLETCMDELKTELLHIQSVIIAASIAGGSEGKKILIESIPDQFTWVDDGKNELTIRFMVDGEVIAESIIKNQIQEGDV